MESESNTNNRTELIKKKLKKIGYQYNNLSEITKQNLELIDKAVDSIIEKEKKSYEELSKVYASINNVSSITGISNKTFFNNRVLKDYLEVKQKEFEAVDQSMQNARLKEEVKELRRTVKLMMEKDIECEPLRRKIDELTKERDRLKLAARY